MKFIVTGGAGFIGSHIVEELLGLGHKAIVVDDLSSGYMHNLQFSPQHCEIHEAAIQDLRMDLAGDIDGVFHMAAQTSVPLSIERPYVSSANNILSTLAAFEIAKEADVPIIYASSSAIYGNLPCGDDRANLFDLASPYAVDKLASEHYARVAHQLYEVRSVGLRFFNVYGPRQDPTNPYSGVIAIFAARAAKNEKIILNGGHQTRDFVYVKNVAGMAVQAMESAIADDVCEQVNICTGKSVSIEHLLSEISRIVRVTPEIEYRRLPPGDPEVSLGTHEKMVSFFGTRLDKMTQLSDGLIETVCFLQRTAARA
jgi:UDP-glucose 4-epimerase